MIGLEAHRVIVNFGVATATADGAARHDADERELRARRGACLAHRLHDAGVGTAVDDVDAQLLAEWHDDRLEQLLRGVERSSGEPLGTPDDDEDGTRACDFELTERGGHVIRARDTHHSCHEAGYRSR